MHVWFRAGGLESLWANQGLLALAWEEQIPIMANANDEAWGSLLTEYDTTSLTSEASQEFMSKSKEKL